MKYRGFLNESDLIRRGAMAGETQRRGAKRSEVGRSLGERARSGALLGEGAQSGTMINEAALGRDKEISVRRSLKVQLRR